MATYTGTSGNDSWNLISPGTFSLDGGAGIDTLNLGTSLRSSYNITTAADGSVHVDSVSGASGALHATLYNMEYLTFNSGQDVLYIGPPAPTPTTQTGTSGPDKFTETSTNTSIDGGAGIDTVVYNGARSGYTLKISANGSATVAKPSGTTDTLTNIERLQFADAKIALDVSGNAGITAKILGAVFGAASVSNPTYVGIGLGYLDNGMSYANLMQLALTAAGATTHSAVVNLLWTNVVGSPPTAAQAAPYIAMLDNGSYTPGTLGVMAADLSLNTANINLVGLQQTGIPYV